jgi:hypothetical protein
LVACEFLPHILCEIQTEILVVLWFGQREINDFAVHYIPSVEKGESDLLAHCIALVVFDPTLPHRPSRIAEAHLGLQLPHSLGAFAALKLHSMF